MYKIKFGSPGNTHEVYGQKPDINALYAHLLLLWGEHSHDDIYHKRFVRIFHDEAGEIDLVEMPAVGEEYKILREYK